MKRRAFVLLVGLCVLVTVTACGGSNPPAPPPAATPEPAAQSPAPAAAPAQADLAAVAKAMVRAGLLKTGEKVLVSGSARDKALLEELAIETMKAGGQPIITITSDQLSRRSYDEVPASFDSQPQTFGLALANIVDVQLGVETSETETVLAGVPPARIASRDNATLAVTAATYKKGLRLVQLGNGLYPTAALASRLGIPQSEIAAKFWKAAMVEPETLRMKGEAIRAVLAGPKQLTLSSANGTKITFGIDAVKSSVSDGAITPEKAKLGMAVPQTWLPAGEVLIPATPGTAEGTVVIDKYVYQGEVIEALTLTFSKGKLTSMTAKSGLAGLKAYYDVSTGGKDQFGYIDLGLNPEATFPTNTGRVIWMAPGGVTIGLGDNTLWSGTNVSNFGLSGAVTNATLAVDGKIIIENGVLK